MTDAFLTPSQSLLLPPSRPPLFPPEPGEAKRSPAEQAAWAEQRVAEIREQHHQEGIAAQNRRYAMVASREAARAAGKNPDDVRMTPTPDVPVSTPAPGIRSEEEPFDLPQIAKPRELTDLRLKLHANGYHPIPVLGAHIKDKSSGKRPTMSGWETKDSANADEIASWSTLWNQRDCTNTGLLCGEIDGIDIDVLDEVLSAKLVARALELFGPSSLRRIGRAPKVLLVYRVETPHEKLSTPTLIFGDDPKDQSAWAKVEILANGQQFVAYGIHPDTRQLYHWPEQSPLDIPASDVPLVTVELLQQFVDEAEQMLRDAGGRTKAEIIEANGPDEAAPPAPPPKKGGVLEQLDQQSGGAISKAFAEANADGESFFKKVNALAINSLSEWVPVLFPTAKKYQGGYRITPEDLGRDSEEDLSILPKGIKDWGVWDEGDPRKGKRTSIDVVMEWSDRTASEAALWLCEQLKMPPETLGWKSDTSAQPKPKSGPSLAIPLTYFNEVAKTSTKHHIIKDVIAKNEISRVIAPPGKGKSAFAIDLAIHVASGVDWRGYKSKQKCGVVYFALERGDLVRRRLHGHQLRDGLADLPIAVASRIINLMHPSCIDIIVATIREAEKAMGCSVGFMVLDVYPKGLAAGGGDENQAKDQGIALANLRRVQEIVEGIHIMNIGHTGKDETRGARGSNSQGGDDDMVIQITGDGSIKTAKIIKINDGEEKVITQFKMEVSEIGVDEDGDPIKTAIVSLDDCGFSAGVQPKAKAKLNDTERRAMDMLYNALNDSGKDAPAAGGFPHGVKVVPVDTWRTTCKRGGLSKGEADSAFRNAFNRVSISLANKGKIGLLDDMVWVAYD